MQTARDKILNALKSAPKDAAVPRPKTPSLNEMSLGKEALIERFSAELASQAGILHRASDITETRHMLSEISNAEGIESVIASNDEITRTLGLPEWGHSTGIRIFSAENLMGRESLKEKAFSADAGLTGAAFAVAESGTIGIAAVTGMPRLVSIAPPVHIAVIPLNRLYPTYETAIKGIETMPSELILITGPSSTADIQATPFKGMHGPGRLFVILLG
ncbi:MAG TPA: lactate utilization protein [Desulfomonilia bacterium]